MSQPEEVQEQPATPPMFDEAICATMRPAINKVLLDHGDVLRSIAVVFDYRGQLNQAQVKHGMWLSSQGEVVEADAIMGSLFGTLNLAGVILDRGFQLLNQMQEQLLIISKELLEKGKQYEELEARARQEIEQVQDDAQAAAAEMGRLAERSAEGADQS